MNTMSMKQALAQGRDDANVIHWRKDRDQYRIWRSWWSDDMFEVVGQDNFDNIQRVAKLLSMRLVEAKED